MPQLNPPIVLAKGTAVHSVSRVIAKYYGQEEECKSFKLGTHIKTAAWDEKGSMVCCLEESRAIFYYFPTAPFVDVDLLKETRETIDLGETIKCAKVESMCHNRCVVALQNESIIHVPISEGHSLPYALSTRPRPIRS